MTSPRGIGGTGKRAPPVDGSREAGARWTGPLAHHVAAMANGKADVVPRGHRHGVAPWQHVDGLDQRGCRQDPRASTARSRPAQTAQRRHLWRSPAAMAWAEGRTRRERGGSPRQRTTLALEERTELRVRRRRRVRREGRHKAAGNSGRRPATGKKLTSTGRRGLVWMRGERWRGRYSRSRWR